MAAVKVKLATGMLTLQEHKAKFARKGEVSSLCPMCKKETENTAHFILQCASLQEVRERPFNLKNIMIPNVAEKNILILVEEKK
jgi:hypothetical protein